MRSELVFKVLGYESNRYLLVKLLAKGTRKMHRPNTRLQDTMNEVLEHFQVPRPRFESPMSESVQVERRAA